MKDTPVKSSEKKIKQNCKKKEKIREKKCNVIS